LIAIIRQVDPRHCNLAEKQLVLEIHQSENVMPDKPKINNLTPEEIEKLRDLEPDALPLPLPENEEILDEIPEEDEFYTPREEKPVPGEGP
jgi:hypothetical protein